MQNSSQNSNEAVFIFAIGIDQQATRDFAINLVDWSGKNPGRPLRINLNSQGGNILDGLFLFDELGRMRRAGHKLTIAVYGRSASSAGWLLQAADRRIMGPHSWLLIHEVTSSVQGGRSAIKRELARVEQLQNQTNDILTSRTKSVKNGLTVEMIQEKIDSGDDWWLDAQTALTLGLIDEIEEQPAFAA